MRIPEGEFLGRGNETCEDGDSEGDFENVDSQKDGGSVEENEPPEEDDGGSEEEYEDDTPQEAIDAACGAIISARPAYFLGIDDESASKLVRTNDGLRC